MENKKKVILPIVMLLLLILATIGVTYAAFTFSQEGAVENTLETSTVMLTYTEGKTGIILEEAFPMSDERGKLLTGTNNVFDFTVQATLGKSTVISYEVTAVKIPITDMTPLEDNEVKLYLERAIDPEIEYQSILEPTNFIPISEATEVGSPEGSMILDEGVFFKEGVTIHNYRLRMWVDEDTNLESGVAKKYGIKINVYAKQGISDSDESSCFTFDTTTGTITDYDDTCSKDVVIPYVINGKLVTNIGNEAFREKQITNVTIPNSVTSIGIFAFYNNQLTAIAIPKDIPKFLVLK